MTDERNDYDHTVDVLVIGSGAGGFTAALTANARGLSTLVVEKAGHFGGSSALSGGGIWAPGAPPQAREGVHPDRAEVLGYLREITEGEVSESRLTAYLENVPKMLGFLEESSEHLRFVWKPGYPDYYPELPGGSAEGSVINIPPIDMRALKTDAEFLLPPHAVAPAGLWIGPNELVDFYRLRQSWKGKLLFARLLWRMARARILGERVVTMGQALMTRLMLAFREQGLQLWLDTPMTSLLTDGDGRAIGAEVSRSGQPRRIRARHGVIVATGGFDHGTEFRRTHQPYADPSLSLGATSNTGDGIIAAQRIGADVALMDGAWWYPAVAWGDGRVQFSLNERMMPAQFIVNGDGDRFINEAAPYQDFGYTMIQGEGAGVRHIPVWLVTNEWCWRRYVIFGHLPLPRIPFAPVPTGRALPGSWSASESVVTGRTLDEIAGRIGVPADRLRRTAERYDAMAKAGRDADFRRGDSLYDRYYSDRTLPHPNLEPLGEGPYYAFALVLSDLGTNGGIVTDERARALGAGGAVIDGLYATGNASATVMGRSYAGAGATLGPAMTFGYVAANDIANDIADGTGDGTGDAARQGDPS
ncbi:FAD-dependent oxidoreductase [Actinomadura barringtoniae]|uniref:3-oxosteroid 1-dehydrogenase n=1 Tax=Actinomadura barringtoniae TaxID=1427535 RepID=A0A939T7J3_9ACTN|nr:FAD-binding protein [Actinomadura barringtoniae]MBO2453173.1 FAD-dependent oxidoreductase [Actinomadura barringtoniae]